MKIKLLLILLALFPFAHLNAQTAEAGADAMTPSDASEAMCKEQLSLYREYHKIKLYSYALPHWRWVFLNCPSASQNIYIDGVKIMSSTIDSTENPELKEKLIDTLLMVYDQRIVNYKREGYVLGRKAIDALSYRPSMSEDAYKWLAKSVELQGNESDAAVLLYYLNTSIDLAKKEKIEKSEIFTVYDKVISIIENNINQLSNEKELTGWMNAKANVELIIEPHASCGDLVKIYEKKFEGAPEDTTLLKNITKMLDKRNCTKEGDLFFRATENLHRLKPDAQSAYLMGRLSIEKEQYGKAAEYMSQAAELYKVNTDKIKALYALTGIYTSLRNYSQARNTAYKILNLNPNEGKAYIMIGDLYAMSAGMCEVDDMGGKTVFWAAIDKYLKAKSVDNSVEQQANEKISQYSRYYPPTQDLFFRDLKEGTPYTVGCWINETTTVRGIK